ARSLVDLLAELAPLHGVEVNDVAHAGNPRHQHQPWVVAVVHQAQVAERERGDRVGVGRQLRMQLVMVRNGVLAGHGRFLHGVQCRASANSRSVRSCARRALAGSWAYGSSSRSKAWPASGYLWIAASAYFRRWSSIAPASMLASLPPKWNIIGARSGSSRNCTLRAP